jgi:hypothetical protein
MPEDMPDNPTTSLVDVAENSIAPSPGRRIFCFAEFSLFLCFAISAFRHFAIPPFRHFAISPFRHFAISPFRHFAIPTNTKPAPARPPP